MHTHFLKYFATSYHSRKDVSNVFATNCNKANDEDVWPASLSMATAHVMLYGASSTHWWHHKRNLTINKISTCNNIISCDQHTSMNGTHRSAKIESLVL
mmetsp:Transcript_31641/g.65186  ORF Transcript_31641/g.65186 Transcript_31641/m.65186 type:complete len:99 (-) Transcript_31641:53-349(-)